MADLIKGTLHHTIDKNGTVVNLKTGKIKKQWQGKNGYLYVDIIENGKTTKVAIHRLLALQYLPNPYNKRTVNHKDGNKLNNNLSNLEWATDSENIKHAHNIGLRPYMRKHSLEEYEYLLLNKIMKGVSITELAKNSKNTLTQLSIHIREAAERLGILDKYEKELKTQKNKRAKLSGLSRRKQIKLQMLDKETNKILKTFNSITEAREYLNKKSSGPITNVLAGRQKTAYGYKWIKV